MYRTIVVGTDGSDTARIAVERACDVAEAFNARLLIVSVFHLGSPEAIQEQKDKLPDEHQWQASRQYAVREALARAQELVGPRNIDYDTRAIEGNPAESPARWERTRRQASP